MIDTQSWFRSYKNIRQCENNFGRAISKNLNHKNCRPLKNIGFFDLKN